MWYFAGDPAHLGVGTSALIFLVTLGITMLVLGPRSRAARRRRGPEERPSNGSSSPVRDPNRIGDVEGFVRGATYRVIAPFTARGDSFAEGELLTYREHEFLPYHGGHTLQFEPRWIYLQEEEDAEVLRNLDRFLVRVS